MIIRKASPEDAREISLLHKKAFNKSHFTANFSTRVLNYYFDNLIRYNLFNYVLIEDDKLIGYLIGGIDPSVGVRAFIKSHLGSVIKTLLFNPGFIPEKISELIKSNNAANIEKVPTIYIIAVDPDFSGGAGKKLLDEFEKDIQFNNYKKYILSVRKNNHKAIKFYKRNNFEFYSESKYSYNFFKSL